MVFKTLTLFPDFTDSYFSDRFNRIDKLFSQLTGNTPINNMTPNYNLRKIDLNNYELIISLPGWQDEELEILLYKNQLNIIGKKKYDILNNQSIEMWLHQGIIKLNFNISFFIPNSIKVKKAHLKNGLLHINLYQEIPDKDKPEKIFVSSK